MDASQTVERMICLFEEYSEWFGLSDADCPADQPQEKQCDFEIKFKEIICEHSGHDIGPDQCGKPEHDYCYRCNKLKTELEPAA